ncbi:MAG: polysaccharide biosynthesis/export family protein [Planctomycetaceae bacterium]|nr:polysaccharide biosynthesis/export family protein [Planctomycetaceae bacterium]
MRRPHGRAACLLRHVGRLLLFMLTGCSAIYHPAERTIEHRMEVLNRMPRSEQVALDPRLLSQTPPHEHLVDDGDILGVYIEGAPGQEAGTMPVRFADDQFVAPAIGYPTPVRSGGYIRVPQVGALHVRGMTTGEIEDLIRRRLVEERQEIKPEKDRIHVSLMWRRSVNVLVIRQEELSATELVSPSSGTDADRRSGQVVNLPIFQNDVLHALLQTGGLPNGQAENAVYVFKRHDRQPLGGQAQPLMNAQHQLRPVPGVPPQNEIQLAGFAPAAATGHSLGQSPGLTQGHASRATVAQFSQRYAAPAMGASVNGAAHSPPFGSPFPGGQSFHGSAMTPFGGGFPGSTHPQQMIPVQNSDSRHPGALRIPLSRSFSDPINFSPGDVILEDGDIVMLESRDSDHFFTAGLLGGGQYALPRDRDLDIIDAVLLADSYSRSTQLNTPTRAIGGVSVLNRDVTVGASRVIVERTTPEGSTTRFRINLYKAMRNPEHRVLIEPGDRLYLEYTAIEAVLAFFERHLLDPVTSGAPAILTD